MSRTQCTLRAARHSRGWKFLSLFLPLVALCHTGNSYAAVMYANPEANSPDFTMSIVGVIGEYSGTTQITQMTQTSAVGSNAHGNNVSLMWAEPTAMRIDFTSPVSFVSMQFLPDDTDSGVLQVYSADNVFLGEQVGRDSNPFTLSLSSSSTPFAYILATFADTGRGIAPLGYEVAAVPEPETWALMLSGLALVGTSSIRRKRVSHF